MCQLLEESQQETHRQKEEEKKKNLTHDLFLEAICSWAGRQDTA